MIKQLSIIGIGLIGGSLARALKKNNFVEHVVAWDTDAQNLKRAVQLGVIDQAAGSIEELVVGADLILLAVPVCAMSRVFKEIFPFLTPNIVITDCGSVKEAVIQDAFLALDQYAAQFVPAHPIAGTEQSGVAASFAELFEGHRCIVTPTEHTSAAALEQVRAMWRQAGSQIVEMDASHHDEILAATSHLPHILSYALVNTVADLDARSQREVFDFAAGGFRDMSRIAGSDPAMWRDICLMNRAPLLELMRAYQAEMKQMMDALEQGDQTYIYEYFAKAQKTHKKL